MFIRHEDFKTFTRLYPIVTTILAINLAIFLLHALFVSGPLGPILNLNAFFNLIVGHHYSVAVNNEWWRLITPIFVHFGLSHLFFNCFSLFLFGPALERMLGKIKFIVAFLGSGILANVGTFFFSDWGFNVIFYGASGAIFGLFGFYLYMVAIRRDLMSKNDMNIVMVILVISVLFTFFSPASVDVLGHLFGLLAGFILAPVSLYNIHRGV
ncbi:rhomboid family intramembrane serine protease [Tuberibacillus sp. Marseille-P3662]|uniref:rhomboid family intramembrane serine protease n=1 Tax=Tuberibacillus sp. Marseille-P3662 TaxID=1965358 RepID=UPI000A1CCE0F|nr:rhomboid family intramembrane serine protease [Tuberibacillus sp. Marseille-P3662]